MNTQRTPHRNKGYSAIEIVAGLGSTFAFILVGLMLYAVAHFVIKYW